MGLLVASVLAIAAGGAGYYAWTQQTKAKSQEQIAVANATRAETASREAEAQAAEAKRQATEAEKRKQETERLREQTQTTESGLLANAASQLVHDDLGGDAGRAMLLTLEALPDKAAGVARPYVPEAEVQLDRALRRVHERQVLAGHEKSVTSAAFSADGARVVTASADTTARVWDAASGREIARLAGHTSTVWTAAFSADGARVVTASSDNSARIWRVFVKTADIVNSAKDRLRRCLTPKQRKAYFLPDAPPLWCVERRLWPYHTDDWQAWLVARKLNPDAPLPSAAKPNDASPHATKSASPATAP
jgi:hypothetical protein